MLLETFVAVVGAFYSASQLAQEESAGHGAPGSFAGRRCAWIDEDKLVEYDAAGESKGAHDL